MTALVLYRHNPHHQIKVPECTIRIPHINTKYTTKKIHLTNMYVTIYATFPCNIIDIKQKNENENVKYVTAALELSFGTGLANADGCREMKGRRKGRGRGR